MVQQTSLEAFQSIQKELGEKQQKVLNAIAELGEVSDKEIAAHLDWPINTVVPRRNELWEKGLVDEAGKKVDLKTGRKCMIWKVHETD